MDILSILGFSGIAALALSGLGLLFSVLLYVAFRFLVVKTDPRLELVLMALPGSNCGACGFAGCQGLADHVVKDTTLVTGCLAGGQAVAKKLADVLGVSLEPAEDKVAFVACRAGRSTAKMKYLYRGVDNCQAASLFFGGDKACREGCLGLGSCVQACPFDAIHVTADGVALVDREKCTSCEKCVKACPRGLISMQPKTQEVLVACANRDKARQAKEVCPLACTACKICEKNCPEKAIVVTDNLAVIDPAKCTQCGICVEKCPQKTIIRLSLAAAVGAGPLEAKATMNHCRL
jgi:electron transport complex protein RnfB